MKANDSPNSSKGTGRDDVFAIPDAVWPKQSVITEIIASIAAAKPPPTQPEIRATPQSEAKTDYFKVLVSVATHAWRVRKEMRDAQTGEFNEEVKQLERHIDAIYQSLAEFGVIVHDHTGDEYDESQPMIVIATRPTPGLDKKRVCETLLPSVFWNNRLIQNGEVKVATPLPSNISAISSSP
jgi:hypothetical protein